MISLRKDKSLVEFEELKDNVIGLADIKKKVSKTKLKSEKDDESSSLLGYL